jgi:hypothetical protein
MRDPGHGANDGYILSWFLDGRFAPGSDCPHPKCGTKRCRSVPSLAFFFSQLAPSLVSFPATQTSVPAVTAHPALDVFPTILFKLTRL